MTETSAPTQSLPELMQAVLARLARGENVTAVLRETGIQTRVNESIAATKEPAFVSVQTVHSALVRWSWTTERVHDIAYKDEVIIAVNQAARQAAQLYDVKIDRNLCGQWERVQFVGDNIADLTVAADQVARKLKDFSGVMSLNR